MKRFQRSSRPWVLLNPGPVNVTENVRRALLNPDICHREEEFSNLLLEVRQKLLKIFGAANTHTVALLSGSGTTALEAMLSSFAKTDQPILVLSNGVYGERIKTILEIHDTPVEALSSPPGGFPDLPRVEALLRNSPSIHGVAMVHHETSTGMLNPVAQVGKLAKKYNKTFLVDAVSSLGGEKLDFKKWGVDFCAGTSGKCLHGFPGLSFVMVSKQEAEKLKHQKPKSLYLNLSSALEWEDRGETPFTPAVQIFYAFDRALDELAEEGLQNRIKKYVQKSSVLEEGFRTLGLRFLVGKESRSHVLTALWMPDGISYEEMHRELKKEGFVIYAGQSELKGKIFRVANLGNVKVQELKRFLFHLRRILSASAQKPARR